MYTSVAVLYHFVVFFFVFFDCVREAVDHVLGRDAVLSFLFGREVAGKAVDKNPCTCSVFNGKPERPCMAAIDPVRTSPEPADAMPEFPLMFTKIFPPG